MNYRNQTTITEGFDYKMEVEQKFEVEIKKELIDKIEWFTNNYDKEIGAWLVGEITDEKIVIEDILIPYQEVSGVSVDTDGKALVRLRKEYGERCSKIIGHWHSHNTMGTSWSRTDEEFIEQFTEPRTIAVFIVSSKAEKHLVRLELCKPVRVSLDNLDYTIVGEDSEFDEAMQKIIDEKLEEKQIVTTQIYPYSHYLEDYPLRELKRRGKLSPLEEYGMTYLTEF